MRKIKIILLALSIATVSQAQVQDKSTLVNEIKLNPNYIYGEATMSDAESAQKLAQSFLKSNLELWIAENVDSEELRGEIINGVDQKCQELLLARGEMFRSFVYIHLNNIGLGSDSEQVTSLEEDQVDNPQEVLSDHDLFEQDLGKVTNVTTLLDLLSDPKYIDRCSCGEINSEAIKTVAIDKAYLLIYNPVDNGVYATLSPRNGGRINILTKEEDSTKNYPNSKGIWIIYQ